MYLTKSILILEDNLKVLSKILDRLFVLENDQVFELCVMVLTTSSQVENYVNFNPKANFDIILLDRDCKIGGSFHVLDIERFGKEKIIGISSIEEFNKELKQKGITKIILKDLKDMDKFADEVVRELGYIIRKMSLI